MRRMTTIPPVPVEADEPPLSPDAWRPDALIPGFECRTLPIDTELLAGEGEDPVVGTLVRHADPGRRDHSAAVLYVHGWNDYFFHPHVADFFERLGYAFHALDLRRYGRSYRTGQYRGYVADLDDYAVELDAAVEVLRETHQTIVLVGHSTGGLTASLYASAHPGVFSAVVLNSPWLAMWGPPALNAVLKPLMKEWGRRSPETILPLPGNDEPVYARALHASYGGEWDYDLELKTPGPDPVRVGWLRAVLQGHARVAKGLSIDCPVLVTTSTRTAFLKKYSEDAKEADIVLDVERIAEAAIHLGDHVTLARIEGGVHDLALSPQPARDRWFSAVERWLGAYGGGPA